MGPFLFLEVWDALLHGLPLIALVRNPGKMTSTGLAQPFSDGAIPHINGATLRTICRQSAISREDFIRAYENS